jgi:copper chaperone
MKTRLYLQNLKCNGCAKTISNTLSEIKNVSEILVNVEEGSVSLNYINEADLLLIKEALKANGYPAIGEENTFGTKAKSYVSCAIGKLN